MSTSVPSTLTSHPKSEWDVYIVKSGNQDVTNSNTYTDDTELQFSGANLTTWYVEFYLIVGGDSATGDIKVQLATSTGNFRWALDMIGAGATGIINSQVANTGASVNMPGAIPLDGTQKFHLFVRAVFELNADQIIKVQFAQNAATPATFARMHAGSILKAKRLD